MLPYKFVDGWRALLDSSEIMDCTDSQHTKRTPERAASVYSFEDGLLSGCLVDPASVLTTMFTDEYDEMVYVSNIDFVSICSHHMVPFLGKAHFAYIPDRKIVGLSKIPRLIDVYSRRPQVQEKLTKEIVRTFQTVVEPKGCGLVMEAIHFCMAIRGVKKATAVTKTSYLAGIFRERPEVRAEFLNGIPHEFKLW